MADKLMLSEINLDGVLYTITDKYAYETLSTKADLVDGVIPLNQIPSTELLYSTKQTIDGINISITKLQSDKANKVHNHTIEDVTDLSNTLKTFAKADDTYTKEDIDNKVSAIYRPKGSVPDFDSLPDSDNMVGDTYTLQDTGAEYVWTGEKWEYIGEKIDLTPYVKKTDFSVSGETLNIII